MESTDKKSIRQLVALLPEFGVRKAVMSPGSRNAPLLVAFERNSLIETRMVVDERSAAFIALGTADISGEPVALVCTSGTAPLNYAPAVAEAFYRNIPLIVITADRPYEWIDQDDSQTIKQLGIYNNYIKGSFDIPTESNDSDRMWYINRTLNDALSLALSGRPGPVHINIHIAEPLNNLLELADEHVRSIAIVGDKKPMLSNELVDELYEEIRGCKQGVLILAGFMRNQQLTKPLEKLAQLPNVVVMHEAQSNLHGVDGFIPNIDATLRQLGQSLILPELVITIGGSLTSRMIKANLRKNNIRHWSVGFSDIAVDCFRHLERRIQTTPYAFITALADNMSGKADVAATPFKRTWIEASRTALQESSDIASQAPWSDFKAMSYIMRNIPTNWNLQLSNGTAVRYAQLFEYGQIGNISCNRGVSGIDGCTSTAIGAATVAEQPTLLITGDMSFQYDMGALATNFIPRNFKIIVLSNGGGGIFRFISSTRDLAELEKCFAGPINLPLSKLADAFEFKYFRANDMASLEHSFNDFISNDDRPAILEIITDGKVSADVLRQYFKN